MVTPGGIGVAQHEGLVLALVASEARNGGIEVMVSLSLDAEQATPVLLTTPSGSEVDRRAH